MKKVLIIIFVVLFLAACVLGGIVYYLHSQIPKKILTFEDCVNARNLVVDTMPRECHTKEGHMYIEDANHKALSEYIQVNTPSVNAHVSSPFKVEGKARGSWYGNNRLVIKLTDQNGRVIVEKPVFALSDTAKDTMVPFVAAISFTPGKFERGKLLIEKTSSVDVPGKNGPLIIPLRFETRTEK